MKSRRIRTFLWYAYLAVFVPLAAGACLDDVWCGYSPFIVASEAACGLIGATAVFLYARGRRPKTLRLFWKATPFLLAAHYGVTWYLDYYSILAREPEYTQLMHLGGLFVVAALLAPIFYVCIQFGFAQHKCTYCTPKNPRVPQKNSILAAGKLGKGESE